MSHEGTNGRSGPQILLSRRFMGVGIEAIPAAPSRWIGGGKENWSRAFPRRDWNAVANQKIHSVAFVKVFPLSFMRDREKGQRKGKKRATMVDKGWWFRSLGGDSRNGASRAFRLGKGAKDGRKQPSLGMCPRRCGRGPWRRDGQALARRLVLGGRLPKQQGFSIRLHLLLWAKQRTEGGRVFAVGTQVHSHVVSALMPPAAGCQMIDSPLFLCLFLCLSLAAAVINLRRGPPSSMPTALAALQWLLTRSLVHTSRPWESIRPLLCRDGFGAGWSEAWWNGSVCR